MLYYFATYSKDVEDYPEQEASNVIVAANGRRDAIAYDRRIQEWSYDPKTIGSWMSGQDNEYRRKVIERAEAEAIALRITGGTNPLPTEEEILQAFAEAKRISEEGQS